MLTTTTGLVQRINASTEEWRLEANLYALRMLGVDARDAQILIATGFVSKDTHFAHELEQLLHLAGFNMVRLDYDKGSDDRQTE